jgi:hypothetical protein
MVIAGSTGRAAASVALVAASWGLAGAAVPAGTSPLSQRGINSVVRSHGWMSQSARGARNLLYVANGAEANVDVFSVVGSQVAQVGSIGNLDMPEGMTTDEAGNLYVVDDFVPSEGPVGGQLLVFPKGANTPSRTINPYPQVPIDVAVDKHGTIYLANIDPITKFSPGSVWVYGASNDTPIRKLNDSNFQQVVGITVEPTTQDVYVAYTSQSGNGGLAVFRKGRGKAVDLGVSYGNPWGLTVDGKGNLLVCDGNGPIDIFAETGGPLLGTISVPGSAEFEAFNKDRSLLYVSNFYNFNVEVFTYPAGTMVGTVSDKNWSKYAWPTGVAYWPPAR